MVLSGIIALSLKQYLNIAVQMILHSSGVYVNCSAVRCFSKFFVVECGGAVLWSQLSTC